MGFNNGRYFARGQRKTPARMNENLIKLEAKSVMLERRQKGVRTFLEEKATYVVFRG